MKSSRKSAESEDKYWKTALYTCVGNLILALLGFVLWNVWHTFKTFREPLAWSLLVSIAIRDYKVSIVKFLTKQINNHGLLGFFLFPMEQVYHYFFNVKQDSNLGETHTYSALHFKWLWRVLLGLQLFKILRNVWREFVYVVLTIVLFIFIAKYVYNFALRIFGIQRKMDDEKHEESEGVKGGTSGFWSFWTTIENSIKHKMIQSLNQIISTILTFGLILMAVMLTLFLSVQVAQEGVTAVRAGYEKVQNHTMSNGVSEIMQNQVTTIMPKVADFLTSKVEALEAPVVKKELSTLYAYVYVSAITCDAVNVSLIQAIQSAEEFEKADSGNQSTLVKEITLKTIRRLEERTAQCLSSTEDNHNLFFAIQNLYDGIGEKLTNIWVSLLEGKVQSSTQELLAMVKEVRKDLFQIWITLKENVPLDLRGLNEDAINFYQNAKDSITTLANAFLGSSVAVATYAVNSSLGMLNIGAGIFNFFLQSGVFASCLVILLSCEKDPLEHFVALLPLKEGNREKVIVALALPAKRVLRCTFLHMLFQGVFTWVAIDILRCLNFTVHFTYTLAFTAAILAMIPLLPSFIVSIPIALQISLQVGTIAALLVILTFYIVFASVETAILKDMDEIPPYLTLLAILGGMYAFGFVRGSLVGPLLLSFVTCCYQLYLEVFAPRATGKSK